MVVVHCTLAWWFYYGLYNCLHNKTCDENFLVIVKFIDYFLNSNSINPKDIKATDSHMKLINGW